MAIFIRFRSPSSLEIHQAILIYSWKNLNHANIKDQCLVDPQSVAKNNEECRDCSAAVAGAASVSHWCLSFDSTLIHLRLCEYRLVSEYSGPDFFSNFWTAAANDYSGATTNYPDVDTVHGYSPYQPILIIEFILGHSQDSINGPLLCQLQQRAPLPPIQTCILLMAAEGLSLSRINTHTLFLLLGDWCPNKLFNMVCGSLRPSVSFTYFFVIFFIIATLTSIRVSRWKFVMAQYLDG